MSEIGNDDSLLAVIAQWNQTNKLLTQLIAAISSRAPAYPSAPILTAALPAASANPGAHYVVTDATATTFASALTGGGANIVPVYSDGTVWRIG